MLKVINRIMLGRIIIHFVFWSKIIHVWKHINSTLGRYSLLLIPYPIIQYWKTLRGPFKQFCRSKSSIKLEDNTLHVILFCLIKKLSTTAQIWSYIKTCAKLKNSIKKTFNSSKTYTISMETYNRHIEPVFRWLKHIKMQ